MEFPKGIQNRVWKVSDALSSKKFKKIKTATLFIADGHHRYETALAYQAFRSKEAKGKPGTRPFDFVQMMFVAMEDPGLVILADTPDASERLISSAALLLSRLSSLGEIHEFKTLEGFDALALDGKTGKKTTYDRACPSTEEKLYALQFSKVGCPLSALLKDISDAQKKLDVTLLHRLILEPFFGITKEKVERELSFTSKAEEAVESLREKKFAATFFLNPTRIEQLREVALKQERMPQKSTYFYPKLVTGLGDEQSGFFLKAVRG